MPASSVTPRRALAELEPRTHFVVITPARDEAATIEGAVRSMLAQTVRPRRWVIVDDGSTDRTAAAVREFLPDHPWIELVLRPDRGHRALGGGVVDAFNAGLSRVSLEDFDFIVKLDADLSFGPEYFERLLQRFDENPRLGIASGKTFLLRSGRKTLEWCHDEHVRGPAKMYSRECFQSIGGLQAVRGWDMIDETTAQMHGFETRSFLDCELIHHRPIDARQPHPLRSRFEMGRLYHHLGYHWLYHIVRCARSALQDPPRGLGGILLLAGYLSAALRGSEQFDERYVAFVRKRQLERMSLRHLRHFLRTAFHRPSG